MKAKPGALLFQAAPFCFGPISTTLNMVRQLAGKGLEIVMIGEGPTNNLLKRENLEFELLDASTTAPFSDELSKIIERANLVISNTDPAFASACMRRGARVAVVDTLYWMWDRLDPILLESDAYLIQNFMGTAEQLERLGRPRNTVLVGPLITALELPLRRQERENFILISLGGCDCNLVDHCQDPYPGMIFEMVEKVIRENDMDLEIIWTTSERPASNLNGRFNTHRVGTFSNQDHVALMRRAKGVILSPGITGSMEAFEAGTPVFFLPPQNYSQALQLRAFREKGVAPFGFSWYDVYPDLSPPPYLPEEQAVSQIRQTIERCASDQRVWDALYQALQLFLRSGIARYDPKPARELRTALGTDGPLKAAQAILQLLD
ncbi:MAG: hypothetical protein IPH12_07695 [Saprospirales bacterium]|nr:hypothetical protein [Saprospirales bacterium]